jgi:hypothetical protein
MNQDRLLNILIAKNIDITKKPFTFLIKGTWGIGKTFLWNEFVERKNGTGKLKFIKFSLFGVESIEQLERQLRNGFIENNSRMKEAVRQSYNVFNKKIAAGQIEVSQFFSFSINTVICFDDLERKSDKLSLKDIMGFIENISLNSTVFILLNEDAIKEAEYYKDFINYKEKIIDYEYELTDVSDQMCNSVLSYSSLKKEYKNEMIRVFQLHKQSNYRILIKIERLVQGILNELKDLNISIVSLCSSVIIEEHSENVTINENIYKENDIKVSIFILREKIKAYLKTNELNFEDFNSVLNPTSHENSEDNKLNKQLIDYIDKMEYVFLKDDEYLKEIYSNIVGFIENHSNISFDVKLIMDLWMLTKSYGTQYESILNVDLEKVDERFINLIEFSISEMNISELYSFNQDLHLKFPYSKQKLFTDEIIQKLQVKVLHEIKLNNIKSFVDAFENKLYEKAANILNGQPILILDKLEIYHLLSQKNVSLELYSFLKQTTSNFMDEDIKTKVRAHLKKLKNEASDNITRDRFITLLSDLR